MIEKKNSTFRNCLIRNILYALVPTVLFIAGCLFYYQNAKTRRITFMEGQEHDKVVRVVSSLKTLTRVSVNNAKYLSELPGAEALIEGKACDEEFLKSTLVSYMRNHPSVVQLRYLNRTGMEVLRINNRNDFPVVIASEELQDKSDRPYFTSVLRARKGDIHISKVDLNIENGKVEIPCKPVLRISVPVFDDKSALAGVFVVNYKAGGFFRDVRDSGLYLLDGEGSILGGPLDGGAWDFLVSEMALGVPFESILGAFPVFDREAVSSGDDLFTRIAVNNHDLAENEGVFIRQEWQVLSVVKNYKSFLALEDLARSLKHGFLIFILMTGIAVFVISRLSYDNEKSRAALHDMRRRLESIAESSPELIFQWIERDDGKSGFSYVSSRSDEYFGLKSYELIERPDAFEREPDLSHWKNLLKEMGGRNDSIRFECRMTLAGKTPRWYRTIARSMPEDVGVIFNGVIVDITEEKTREEERERVHEETRQLGERLSEANVMLTRKASELTRLNGERAEFMAMATHDLKNPLAAIQSLSEFLKEDLTGSACEKVMEYVDLIQKSSAHMKSIMDGIISIEAMEAGKLQLDFEMVDVVDLAREACSEMTLLAKAKNIELKSNFPEKLMATVDPVKIREVMDNFLSNAVKYSPEKRTVYISLERRNAGNHDVMHFSVKDEGPGLTDKDKKLVFGKFQKLSARPTGGEGSTGLGLSIAKRLIEAHDGEVGLESEYGKGATFFFDLFIPKENLA